MENLIEQLRNLVYETEARFQASQNDEQREQLRQEILGRKGKLAELLSHLPQVSEEQRGNVGKVANEAKERIERILNKESATRVVTTEQAKLASSWTKSERQSLGGSHPITQFMDMVQDVFHGMGFDIVDSGELEDEKHNFDLLNIPEDHPVRDEWDTFFVNRKGKQDTVLRTHTSPMQIRSMKNRKPPVRIIVPGRVFRREASDMSHSAVFYQCEGFIIDRRITLADLMGTLSQLLKKIYGAKTEIRFRPHHYAFVEPGMDVDMKHQFSKDEEPRWLEMLGSGMIHPTVLKNMGVDPEVYSGFAFGLGIDRLAMLYWGIDDIRNFYSGDLTFLAQFK